MPVTVKSIYNSQIGAAEAIIADAKRLGREEDGVTGVKLGHAFADLERLRIKMDEETLERQRRDAGRAFAARLQGDTFGRQKSQAEMEAEKFDGGGGDRDLFNKALVGEPGQATRTFEIPRSLQRYRSDGWKNGRDQFVMTSGVDSGNLVPRATTVPSIVRRWYNSFLQAMHLGGQQPILTATGETLVIPVMDDTSITGNSPAENATADDAADPTVSDVTLGATLFGSKTIWLSNTMINAVGYDLVGYLLPLLDKRVELAEDLNFITALLAAQSTTATEDYSATGNTVTCASASACSYAEMLKLYHKLPVPYRSDGVFILADTLIQALESLEDSNGRPLVSLFSPFMNGVLTKTIWGCPVVPSLNMPSLAANSISGAFVSAECLKARYVTNRRIARYTNIPTYPDQCGFQLFENAAAGVNPAGLSFLKMGAS